jgi:hypothetical protein
MGLKPRVASRTFDAEIVGDDRTSGCAIAVPFDPREVFGAVRAPVVVEIGEYSYRSTIARMGGRTFVPLRREHREATGLSAGGRAAVTLRADTEPRVIEPPADLARELAANPAAAAAWKSLSYSHRREHAAAIEEAVKPETRRRRIERALAMLLRTR